MPTLVCQAQSASANEDVWCNLGTERCRPSQSLVSRPVRHQDDFNPPPFFSSLTVRTQFNPRSIHALFLVQILFGALGPLCREFLRTSFLRFCVTHHNDLRLRIVLQTNRNII